MESANCGQAVRSELQDSLLFSGKAVVVLSHGLTKEREIPESEINRAVERKKQVEADFGNRTFRPKERRRPEEKRRPEKMSGCRRERKIRA